MTGPTSRTRASASRTLFSARYAAKKTTRMTLSSSDGWPLNGPSDSVRREPLTSEPKTKVSARSADAGRRPGVLVEAQPAVRAEADGDGRRHRQRHSEPQQLEVAEPERPGSHVLDDEVLREPLHEEQPEAAQEGGRRQDHLVEAPPGDDQDEVCRQQASCVERERTRIGQLDAAGALEAQREASHRKGGHDGREEEQLAPPRPGAAGIRAARERRRRPPAHVTRALARAACGPRRSGSRRRSRGERCRDTSVPCDVRAVRAPEVLHVPGGAPEGQHRVLGRRVRVVEHHAAAEVAPQGRHRIEGEDGARRRLTGRRDDHQPAQGGRGITRRGAHVAQQRPRHEREGEPQQRQEGEAHAPQGEVEGGVGHAAPPGGRDDDLEAGRPDVDPVAGGHDGLPDHLVVDAGPVGAPEVLQDEAPAPRREARVAPGHQGVGDHHVGVRGAPDRHRVAVHGNVARRATRGVDAEDGPGGDGRRHRMDQRAIRLQVRCLQRAPSVGEGRRDPDVARVERRHAEERDARALRDPVPAPPGVVEGGRREVVLEARHAGQRRRVRGADLDHESRRRQHAVGAGPALLVDRPLQPADERHRLQAGAHQAGGGTLEQALEEAFEGGERSHVRRRASVRAPRTRTGDDRAGPGVPRSPGRSDPYGILSAPRMGPCDPPVGAAPGA